MGARIVAVALILLLALALLANSGLGQTSARGPVQIEATVNIEADGDATLRSWQPGTNLGAAGTLEAIYDSTVGSGIALSLVHFDVGVLPAAAIVDEAVLELTLVSGSGLTPVNLRVSEVLDAWDESTVTAGDNVSVAVIGIVRAVDTSAGAKQWSGLAGLVNSWRNGANNGLALLGPLSGSNYARTFASREAVANRPRLIVTYHLPDTPTPTNTPVPPTATPTNTPVPPTATPTNTPLSPAATPTPTATPTATATDEPPPPPPPPGNGLPSLGRSFSGLVRGPDALGEPIYRAQVGLYGSDAAGNLGQLLVTGLTGVDGRFTLLHYTEPAQDYAYYFLALADDPNHQAVSAVAGQGGTRTNQNWIRFAAPGSGGHHGNDFRAEQSRPQPLLALRPDLVPQLAFPPPIYFAPSPAPPVTDVSFKAIEITQAIQCLDQSNGFTNCPDNSLTLSDQKETAIRVYLGHTGGWPTCPQPTNPLPETMVTVRLTWLLEPKDLGLGANAGLVGTSQEQPATIPCTNDLKEMRDDLKASANFFLTPDLFVKKGKEQTLFAFVEIEAPAANNADTSNDKGEAQATLTGHETMRIIWLRVHYQPDNPNPPTAPFTGNPLPDVKQATEAVALMQRMYPMPVQYVPWKVLFFYGSHPKSGVACPYCPDVRDDRDTLLDRLAFGYFLLPVPRPAALIGWLPDGALKFCGGQGGTGTYKQKNFDAPVAWIAQCPDLDSSSQVLAHEVGHTQDLWHIYDADPDKTEKCWPFPRQGSQDNFFARIRETGLDVATRKIYPVTSTDDFMSTNGWISPYNWMKLSKEPYSAAWANPSCVKTAAAASAPAARPAPAATAADALFVSGRLHQDGSGQLEPLFQLSSPLAPPAASLDGAYCLDLKDGAGATLYSTCFDAAFGGFEGGETQETDAFTLLLPAPAGASSVILRRGATVLDQRQASANAPAVAITSPAAGVTASGATTLAWTASDADGDPLQFRVLYSNDNGQSWSLAADAQQNNSIELDTTWLAGGEQARIRVLASDGFHTAAAESGVFQVPGHPPQALILSPQDGAWQAAYEAVSLSGFADDLEDGQLDGESLSWHSDRDGFLGYGSAILLPGLALSQGQHKITLTAEDAAGQQSTATISLIVGTHRVLLPLVTGSPAS